MKKISKKSKLLLMLLMLLPMLLIFFVACPPVPATYTITIDPTPTNGSITLDPATGPYDEDTVVTVTAQPSTNYSFSGWGGDLSGNTNPTTLTMTQDYTITATFENRYTLGGSYDTIGSALGVDVVGNYAYLADSTNGLVILDISDPANPTEVGHLDTDGDTQKVRVYGNYAYLADGNSPTDGDLKVIDISDPTTPTLVDDIVLHDVRDVRVAGNYAYAANWTTGLSIIDISDPANIAEIATVDTDGSAVGIFVKDNYVYVGDGSTGMKIFDITDPANPSLTGSFATVNYTRIINVIGNTAYLASGSHVEIVDVTDKANPSLISSYASQAWSVYTLGDFIYVGDNNDRLTVLDISTPSTPVLDGEYLTTGNIVRDVFVLGEYIYLAASAQGLVVVNNPNIIAEYSLTITDDGNGSVIINPEGGAYSEGTSVFLTPVPNSGYDFDGWAGTDSADVTDNGNGTYSIVMDADKSLSVTFSVQSPPNAPTFNPVEGDFTNGLESIEILYDAGASVRYTLDGTTTPTDTVGTEYTGAINPAGHYTYSSDMFTVNIKAVAYNAVGSSAVASGTFTITPDIQELYTFIVGHGELRSTTDSNGYAHMTYYDGEMHYGTNASGSWVLEQVTSTPGEERPRDIVIDSNNKVHIVYAYWTGTWAIYYATNASGSWVSEEINSSVGMDFAAMALDSSNYAHISYISSSNNLEYATNSSGTWVTETINSDTLGSGMGIDIDSSGNLHIAYTTDTYEVKYVTGSYGSWGTAESVITETNTSPVSDLILDSNGKVYICYSLESYYLKVADNVSGSWVVEQVEAYYRKNGNMAFDSEGYLHIAYQYSSPGSASVHYATNRSGSWEMHVMASNAGTPYIFIGADDTISFLSEDNSVFKQRSWKW